MYINLKNQMLGELIINNNNNNNKTLTLASMQISICINTYIILIFHEHCNEHCKLMSKESAF